MALFGTQWNLPKTLRSLEGVVGSNPGTRRSDVWGRFRVSQTMAERLRRLTGPVLLVDDYVDTRWTITVAARLLRRAGAPEVMPFTLAVCSSCYR